jgi:Glyoxalase-like domain
MLVDHLIYAVPELTAAVADLEQRLGVRAELGGRHIGLGTHNALLALGPRTYLEIIAPDPGQPEPAERPFGISDLDGSRMVGWALACDDIDRAVTEARSHGYDPGEVADGHRTGPTGTVLRWRATDGPEVADLIPFLICWGGADHPARTAPSGLSLTSVQIKHPDPGSIGPALTALGADVEITWAATPALVAHLAGPAGHVVLE